MPPPTKPTRRWLALPLLAASLFALAACGGEDGGNGEHDEPDVEFAQNEQREPNGENESAGAPAPGNDEEAAVPTGEDEAYTTALRGIAADLEEALESIAEAVEAGDTGDALARLEAALPELVGALGTAVDRVAELQPPMELRAEHGRLVAGLQEIVALEEQLVARVEAGDAAGALARAESIGAQQSALEASLSSAMREAAGPLLGVAGALGFLPLGAGDLTPSSALELPPVETERYLAALDFPGSERLLTLDPLIVGEAVLVTAQLSVPAETSIRELLDFYETALRSLGAEGEAQRFESATDGAVTIGVEHPFGSAIVMLGSGADESHLVSVTGSFPAEG